MRTDPIPVDQTLAPIATPSTDRAVIVAANRPRNLALLFTAAVAGAVIATLGLPLAATAMLVAGGVGFALAVAADALRPLDFGPGRGRVGPPLRPAVEPSDLASVDLEHAYTRLLVAHERVRRALCTRDSIAESLRDIYLECGELVQVAGRAAELGSRLETYLESHLAEWLEAEIERLEARGAATDDAPAARSFSLAASSRRRQLQTYRQIEGLHARVEARLAMLTGFLAALEATAIKLDALDFEQIERAGGELADDLDHLRIDLEALEASLALVQEP